MSQKRLLNKVIVITGGAGLLGQEHAKAVLSEGGTAILLDIDFDGLVNASTDLVVEYGTKVVLRQCDITNDEAVSKISLELNSSVGVPCGLVNNAAINPSVEKNTATFSRVQSINYEAWNYSAEPKPLQGSGETR